MSELCANKDCRHGKNTRPDGKKRNGHGGKLGHCFCGCKVLVRDGNGKDADVEVVEGNAPRPRRKKGAKVEARASLTGHLPGMEPKVLPSVHNAIEDYVEVRDRKKKLTELEAEKKNHLIQVMKKAGVTEYNVDGHTATIEANEKVKAELDSEAAEPEVHAVRGSRVDSVNA